MPRPQYGDSAGVSTVVKRATANHVFRIGRFILALLGAAVVVRWPRLAPYLVFVSLVCILILFTRAWRFASGTALRAAVAWGFVAIGLGLVSQGFAALEPLSGGRPAAGHFTYLCTLATIAALVSVLNARTPGSGAWAILMALLLLLFLIPWLEASGLGAGPSALSRLRLDSPWTIFYGLLVVAGITNYLPTRHGPSVLALGVGLVLEYVALTNPSLTPRARAVFWSLIPWLIVTSALWFDLLPRRVPTSGLEARWFWFLDHWGVVWGLRVQERFNSAAAAQRWPIRLSWHGVVATRADELPATLDAAETTLGSLIRRFAEPARIVTAARSKAYAPCPDRRDER